MLRQSARIRAREAAVSADDFRHPVWMTLSRIESGAVVGDVMTAG